MKTPAELATAIRMYGYWQGPDEALDALVEMAERYKRGLEKIGAKQQETLETLRSNGIVFDNISDHWQKVGFTIYTDLCEMDAWAHHALDDGVLG